MVKKRIVLGVGRDPWDQQPLESDKQYSRFSFYRDIGRLRDTIRTHKMLTAAGDTIKWDSLRQTAYKYRWVERAQAFDAAQDDANRERMIIEREDMIRRHRSIANAIISKALKALKEIRIEDLTSADVARYIKLATDIERIAIGEPQTTIAITGPSGGPIQTEDITNLTPEERRTRLAEIAAELARRATDTDEDE